MLSPGALEARGPALKTRHHKGGRAPGAGSDSDGSGLRSRARAMVGGGFLEARPEVSDAPPGASLAVGTAPCGRREGALRWWALGGGGGRRGGGPPPGRLAHTGFEGEPGPDVGKQTALCWGFLASAPRQYPRS